MEPARSYRDRIVRVYDYIKENIAGDLSVDRLSDVACLSPYHFHRVYRRSVGETLNGAVRRCRMYQGGKLLIDSSYSIAEVSFRTGYNRVDSFSRAFQRYYGYAPDQYQRYYTAQDTLIRSLVEGDPVILAGRNNQLPHSANFSTIGVRSDSLYQVEIIDLERIELIGLISDSTQEVLEPKFVDLNLHVQDYRIALDSMTYFGLFYKDYVGDRSLKFKHRHAVAALAVGEQQRNALEKLYHLPFKLQSIPAGKYASYVYIGPYSLSEYSHEWLIAHWLPAQGLRATNGPVIEQYLNDPRTTGPSQLRTRVLIQIDE